MSEFEFLRPCADAVINQIRKKCVSRILTVTARPRYRVGDDPLFDRRATRRYGPLSQACLLEWRPCGRRKVQLNNMQVTQKILPMQAQNAHKILLNKLFNAHKKKKHPP